MRRADWKDERDRSGRRADAIYARNQQTARGAASVIGLADAVG